MTKRELKNMIRESIEEIVYDQMVGIHELVMFYEKAPKDTVDLVDHLFKSDKVEEAWNVVKKYLSSEGK